MWACFMTVWKRGIVPLTLQQGYDLAMPDTIIGAVAPAVTAFVLAKIGETSAEQRRSKFLQQHQNRIGFWQTWVQAQTLVCTAEQLESVKETARLQLDAIQLEMSAFAQASPRIDPPA